MDFAAESAYLCPTSKTGSNESADRVPAHYPDKHLLVFRQMWSRSDYTHVTAQDIEHLRQLVNAELPQPSPGSVNSWVILRGLLRLTLIRMHGAVFEHSERMPHHAGPHLLEKDRAW